MTDRTALKSLLKVGTTLLQPPAPLPSAPAQILERLRQSSLLVPEWRDRAGWREEDELEEIGDDDETDAARRKERRDALVLAVGLRCLDILVAMQGVLEREFWPVEQRGIMEPKDCRSWLWRVC
jgi:hypothetical protein